MVHPYITMAAAARPREPEDSTLPILLSPDCAMETQLKQGGVERRNDGDREERGMVF